MFQPEAVSDGSEDIVTSTSAVSVLPQLRSEQPHSFKEILFVLVLTGAANGLLYLFLEQLLENSLPLATVSSLRSSA